MQVFISILLWGILVLVLLASITNIVKTIRAKKKKKEELKAQDQEE